jgi:HAE1 family hydrophobic/amphiphilic exporter-1
VKLPAFSVRRPVFISMVTLIVILLGLSSLSRLQIDLLPGIEMPTLTVRTGYEGASPVVMERLVTQIVEEIVATVPGVEQLTSESSEGNSSVTVRFNWGTNIDTAAIDVQAQLENEINELPDDVQRPRIHKFDVASFPVVIMGISSTMDPVELTRLIETRLRFRLARIPGVAQVDTWGQYQREIRIELDPAKVNALGVSLGDILSAPRDANLDLPAGAINQGKYEVTLRAPADYTSLQQISDTVVAKREGGFIRLGQIAEIRDSYEKRTRITRLNGNPGLNIAIRKQPGANTVDVAAGVLREIEEINRDFPQLHVVPVTNQGNFIEQSIKNVAQSVLYGGGLAVFVLLLFLRNIRSTLIITLAIPISIIATFAMIYFGGFTINLMSLGGLALGVGMMVDSSVVVLENIYRRCQENGETPATAATNGAEEVGTAIVASTLTTLVIFVPIAFVQGVSGQLFKELGFTIMFSLTCSLFVSLSLVPMFASKMLDNSVYRNMNGQRQGWAMQVAERAFAGLGAGYGALLSSALRHRRLVIGLSTGLLASTLLLVPFIGSDFLPPSDEGEVRVVGEMEVGTRIDLVDRQTKLMEAIVMPNVPEMVSSITFVRAGGRNARSTGEIRISLGPAAERKRTNTQVAAQLRTLLEGRIPGMTIRTRAPQGQFVLERILGGDQGVTVEVRGFDLDTLDRLAENIGKSLESVSGITDVDISRTAGVPQQELLIDRGKVADLGLTLRDVTRTLESGLVGAKVGEFRSNGESSRILVQLRDIETLTMDEILNLVLSTPGGNRVALRNLVVTRPGRGPALIERKDQQRIVSVKANVDGRDLGSIVSDVREVLDTVVIPEGYEAKVAGNVQEQERASRELVLSLLMSLVLVFMVMACQYESFVDPLIVMASVPLAAIGVLLILFLTGTTLNLQSYIGCIMLGGIVVNNAILLVDQAVRLLRHGYPVADAVTEAGRRRLRPILMTSLTTVLALVPLALGLGEGADAQAPLARAVVGGLSASTLITLVLIPVIFSMVHRDKVRKTP